MVSDVKNMHYTIIVKIQLIRWSFTQRKMQMVFGKLHFNVQSVVVELMVLSISMIVMQKTMIEQFRAEDREIKTNS